MPSFPGGPNALFEYLSKNIKYPVFEEKERQQGRVIVKFVVDTDGTVTNVKVAKSVNSLLDAEAIRVTKAMPRWIPGKKNGEAVPVEYTIPITFHLQ